MGDVACRLGDFVGGCRPLLFGLQALDLGRHVGGELDHLENPPSGSNTGL
jgi:hypothetical protein